MMKLTLTKRDVLIASIYTLWRLFQASVVIPASFVGAVLLVMAFAGDSPLESTVASIVHWAETSIRPAPAGAVLVFECAESTAEEAKGASPPVICQSHTVKAVPVDEAVANASRWIRRAYLIAVLISAGGLALLTPSRKFFGLEAHRAA
ncbi:hypothetical protein [Cupriavidus sp. USMAA2-4]|uniref:hypothetical protein n=1 Tax=Cupriavidus sp. USMAA2-4 TaxID=876364 RepID=UPI000A0391E1|nr:hypothetical protein [Cupriavidus sp. USMAA2-4]